MTEVIRGNSTTFKTDSIKTEGNHTGVLMHLSGASLENNGKLFKPKEVWLDISENETETNIGIAMKNENEAEWLSDQQVSSLFDALKEDGCKQMHVDADLTPPWQAARYLAISIMRHENMADSKLPILKKNGVSDSTYNEILKEANDLVANDSKLKELFRSSPGAVAR